MREGHEGHEEREKENVSVVRPGLAELRLRPCYLKEDRPRALGLARGRALPFP